MALKPFERGLFNSDSRSSARYAVRPEPHPPARPLHPGAQAAPGRRPESARILAAASLTTNTRRAYSGALARLDSFLAGRHSPRSCPASIVPPTGTAANAVRGRFRRGVCCV